MQPKPAERKPAEQGPDGGALTLNLPMITLKVRKPELPSMHLPDVGRDVGHAVDTVKTFLPPPERIMYYGGLGVLAAVGMIEWPVAAAIGVGTMIAQRARGQRQGERVQPAAGGRRKATAE
jgi:hypothetical protein